MSAESKKELSKEDKENQFNKDRRDFLRKSKYAAYMTPVMYTMVVDKAAAAQSAVTCNAQGKPTGCTPP